MDTLIQEAIGEIAKRLNNLEDKATRIAKKHPFITGAVLFKIAESALFGAAYTLWPDETSEAAGYICEKGRHYCTLLSPLIGSFPNEIVAGARDALRFARGLYI